MRSVKIDTEYIKLDQLLKYEGLAGNGAEAKAFILKGMVKVNNEVELRRGRKLYKGDVVEYKGKEYTVA